MGQERRREPRYTRRIEARVGNLDLHTTNVSQNGAQLVCSLESFPRIEAVLGTAPVAIAFTLPSAQTVTSQARVAYISNANPDVLIGVRLENFLADGAGDWQRYIARIPITDLETELR